MKKFFILMAIIATSLSPMIVQEDWIEKWDGKLPTYSGSGTPLISLPK